jgi:hypothetical protein
MTTVTTTSTTSLLVSSTLSYVPLIAGVVVGGLVMIGLVTARLFWARKKRDSWSLYEGKGGLYSAHIH